MSNEIKNKERKVFLENLPTKEGRGILKGKQVINWGKCIGHKVKFVYDDVEGEIEIIGYEVEKKNHLTLKYNDSAIKSMFTGDFKECKLGGILNKKTKEFKVDVGANFQDEKRNLNVTDRYYKKDKNGRERKYYKYTCNKCGWTNGNIEENSLIRGVGCSSCCNNPQNAVLGINTIWDTDRWMCELGVSEEDAKGHTRCSEKTINVSCIYCGSNKDIVLKNIYIYKSIGCSCSDGRSYPEKFIACFLNQLNEKYKTEYRPKWSNNKRYDFHIISNNSIIETHGSQHPGTKHHNIYSFNINSKQELENDIHKEELAKDNGIKNYIVIDCSKSDMEFIKNEILNSKLAELYDLSNIDWLGCEKFALKNIVKEVCDYWNQKEEWETTTNLTEKFNLSKSTVTRYLHKGTSNGWCNYSSNYEKRKNGINYGSKRGRYIEIFKDGASLNVFKSVSELSKEYKNTFGIKLSESLVRRVCDGKRNHHKGYTFRYITKEEYEQRKQQST